MKILNIWKRIVKRNLLVLFLLIVGMTIVAKAGDIKSPEVKIEAMIVEIPSYELEKLGIDQNKILEGGTTESLHINSEKFQIIKNKLQTGEIKGKVLAVPSLQTIAGEQATLQIMPRKVHYMIKRSDNLYELKTLDSGITFTATPFIEDDIITLTLNLRTSDMKGRQILSEAPDLDMGIPLTTLKQISTTVSVKNGETIVIIRLGRIESNKEELDTLLFITANIIHQ